MYTTRTLLLALCLGAAFVSVPPAAAHHQDHIVMTGFGNMAFASTAPAGWACMGPFPGGGGTWEVTCVLASSTWCAEPTIDVVVNSPGFVISGVVGQTVCREYTGGMPGATLTTGCLAWMPPGITTDSCSGFSGGYIDGDWIEFVCRATPGGAVLLDWTVDCGLITGP